MSSAPECPDTVSTANGASVCDGQAMLGDPPPARLEELVLSSPVHLLPTGWPPS